MTYYVTNFTSSRCFFFGFVRWGSQAVILESSPEGEAAIGCHAFDGINSPPGWGKSKVVEIPFIYQRFLHTFRWFSISEASTVGQQNHHKRLTVNSKSWTPWHLQKKKHVWRRHLQVTFTYIYVQAFRVKVVHTRENSGKLNMATEKKNGPWMKMYHLKM